MKPWMSDQEIDLVKKYLSEDKVMLEWGSGGSTCTFSPLVKEYYSIEHVKEWYENVEEFLKLQIYRSKVFNYLVEPDKPRTIPTKYEEFQTYIEYVDKLNKKYDIVLIDGRARLDCAKYIIPYLNENAVIFIHDYFHRPQYYKVTDYYTQVDAVTSGQSIAAFKLKI